MAEITEERIAQIVRSVLSDEGAAIEDNGPDGDVPLVGAGDLVPNRLTVLLARVSDNGAPLSYAQALLSSVLSLAGVVQTDGGGAVPRQIHGSGDTSVSIAPNVLHVWTQPMSSLAIAFSEGAASVANEYMLQFTCPALSATVLTMPGGISWIETPELKAGRTYQISVLDGLGVIGEWEN